MPKVFLTGDSTVSDYDLSNTDLNFLYPRNGYGMWINRYFKGSVYIKNLALPGRSSLSFISEDNYRILKSEIKEGDYLVVAFSHNDEKYLDDKRFTFGAGDLNDPESFKYHLYNYYIKLAGSVGAHAVLCTPIVRRSPENVYTGDRIHSIGEVTSSGVKYPPSDYPEAIRELAEKFDLPLVDMTEATKKLYSDLGADKNVTFHATTSEKQSDTDNTHLNSYGAAVIARVFATELKKTKSDLKNYLLEDFYTPVFSDLYVNKI